MAPTSNHDPPLREGADPGPARILGLAPGASLHDARRAYLAAARRLHPDINSARDAAEAFVAVHTAWETLSRNAAGRPAAVGRGVGVVCFTRRPSPLVRAWQKFCRLAGHHPSPRVR